MTASSPEISDGERNNFQHHHLPRQPSSIARSQSRHNRLTALPDLPPPPPPHDDIPLSSSSPPSHNPIIDLHHLEKGGKPSQTQDSQYPLPVIPPLTPSKSFYNKIKFSRASRDASPTFLETYMAKHPRIARHRRRFAALIFFSVVIVLLLVVLLAVVLSRKASNSGSGGYGQPIGGESGGTYPTSPEIEEELREHNANIPRPPINRSNAPGWVKSGQGDGTYYDPAIKNGAGTFQQGACEFPYINSVYDMIAALNKPDFGSFTYASQSPACGQCLIVRGPKGTVEVQVVDMCPGCKSGSLDLSPGAFARIADIDAGRVPISWERCP